MVLCRHTSPHVTLCLPSHSSLPVSVFPPPYIPSRIPFNTSLPPPNLSAPVPQGLAQGPRAGCRGCPQGKETGRTPRATHRQSGCLRHRAAVARGNTARSGTQCRQRRASHIKNSAQIVCQQTGGGARSAGTGQAATERPHLEEDERGQRVFVDI